MAETSENLTNNCEKSIKFIENPSEKLLKLASAKAFEMVLEREADKTRKIYEENVVSHIIEICNAEAKRGKCRTLYNEIPRCGVDKLMWIVQKTLEIEGYVVSRNGCGIMIEW